MPANESPDNGSYGRDVGNAMDAEGLQILLTVVAAFGLHLGVRWYLRHGLAAPDKGTDWRA